MSAPDGKGLDEPTSADIFRLAAVTDEGALIVEPAYLAEQPTRRRCLEAGADFESRFGGRVGMFFTIEPLVLPDAERSRSDA